MSPQQNAAKRSFLSGSGHTRRWFLQAAGSTAALQAMGWSPTFRIGPTSDRVTLPAPPAFPSGIPFYQQLYRNWSGETVIQDVWTAAPGTAQEVADLANWALEHGWRIRPKGMGHGWSPLLLPQGETGNGYLLVDTTRTLTALSICRTSTPATVTAQTGIALETLLQALGEVGLGFTTTPAVGNVTLGGLLAVNGHGAAIQARGEAWVPGMTFGSLSNAVLSLTAVVWDSAAGRYHLRTFQREDPGIAPLLVHVGRAFLTEATLQVVPDRPLRCRSYVDLSAAELFAAPAAAGAHAFQNWVLEHGRAEAIWFPFAREPWLKVWTVAPEKPWSARRVWEPYAYDFANWMTPAQSDFVDQMLAGNLACTPAFQVLEMVAVITGLGASGTWDIWGPSRCSTLYVKPTTLRLAENGYAVLTQRRNIQKVVHEFYRFFRGLVARYQAQGQYPMNGPVEIRVTGLDRPEDVERPGAVTPQLSALRPRPDRPEWDCAVWLDALTFPGTPGAQAFYTELEAWMLGNYDGESAGVRVEWSKGWGYTAQGPWTSPELIPGGIARSHSLGQTAGEDWAAAMAALAALDPHRIFSNPFLDRLMG